MLIFIRSLLNRITLIILIFFRTFRTRFFKFYIVVLCRYHFLLKLYTLFMLFFFNLFHYAVSNFIAWSNPIAINTAYLIDLILSCVFHKIFAKVCQLKRKFKIFFYFFIDILLSYVDFINYES